MDGTHLVTYLVMVERLRMIERYVAEVGDTLSDSRLGYLAGEWDAIKKTLGRDGDGNQFIADPVGPPHSEGGWEMITRVSGR